MARPDIKAAVKATADRNGIITPSGVVNAAKNPNNPLHGEFIWDDSIAAHQHRLDVARSIIRSVQYVSLDKQERRVESIEYVHDPRAGGGKQAYVPLTSVARDRQLAIVVLEAEFARIESALERAEEIADRLNIGDNLKAMVEAMMAARRKVKAKAKR